MYHTAQLSRVFRILAMLGLLIGSDQNYIYLTPGGFRTGQ